MERVICILGRPSSIGRSSLSGMSLFIEPAFVTNDKDNVETRLVLPRRPTGKGDNQIWLIGFTDPNELIELSKIKTRCDRDAHPNGKAYFFYPILTTQLRKKSSTPQ